MQTYSGGQFWPLEPRVEDVHITDIAHAIGKLCRFSGHLKCFYSVAEHSIRVSRFVPAEYALWGLLHDAAEAFISDIPRPVKRNIGPTIGEVEERILRVVAARFGLPWPMSACVVYADNVLLSTEARDLFVGGPVVGWTEALGCQPLPEKIEADACLSPDAAPYAFLRRAAALGVTVL
jgi:hypothetical protein